MSPFQNDAFALPRTRTPRPRTAIRFVERHMSGGRDLRAFAIALCLVGAALVLRGFLGDLGSGIAPFITLFPAIAIAAVFSGPLATGIAAGLGLLATNYFWMEPAYAYGLFNIGDEVNTIGFALGSGLIIWAAAELRAAVERAKETSSMLALAQAYFDIAGNILLVIGVDGAVMEINRRGVTVLGLATASDIIGLDWIGHFVPNESQDEVRSVLRSVLVGGTPSELESLVQRVDGRRRRVAWRYARLRNADGAATAIVASGVDLTELRDAERALRQGEATFRAVLHQIPAAAAVIGAPLGRLILQSDKTAELLGRPMPWDSASIDGVADAGNRADPEGQGAITSRLARALAGEVVHAEAFTYRRPDGSRIELEAYATPVRDIDGSIIAAVGMAFDVSERRRWEAALLASRNRLKVALEAGSLGTVQIDMTTGAARIGPRLAAMLSLPAQPTDLRWMRLLDFIHPDDRLRVARLFRATVTTGERFSDEFRIRTAAGETRWVASQGALLPEDGSAIGVVRDVTHRREREDALREAIAARELLMREADHRIKNSLQLVVSLLRLQQRDLTDPEAARAVDGAVARVNAVAASHLALQKSKNLRCVTFGNMLNELCDQLSTLAPDIDIVCEADGDLELDADRAIPLALVVSEVITNALRHAYGTGDAGLVIVSASVDDDEMRVRITDYGRGMPDNASSSGLGSRVITAMSAQIKARFAIESRAGVGTVVTIALPLGTDTAYGPEGIAAQSDA